jgi:hypothetical protein
MWMPEGSGSVPMIRSVLVYTLCTAPLLDGCRSADDAVPANLPKQAQGSWGSDGKGCPRLDGDYRFVASDGQGFVPADGDMPPAEFGQWTAVRVESRSPVDYVITRSMTKEDFLGAAMRLRTVAPDRYVHWRADTLENGGRQRFDRAYANPNDKLKPWLAQVQRGSMHVQECDAGWVTLLRTSHFVENAEGLKVSEYLKVDVTPDVEKGLLMRTTRCRFKNTQVLNIDYCPRYTTSYARMAPVAWPERWATNEEDLPPLPSAAPLQRSESTPLPQATKREPQAPPPETSKLAASILDRLADKLPPGATLGSITAATDGVVLVMRSATPEHVREVTAMLLADPDVGDLSNRSMDAGTAGATEYSFLVKPRRQ